MLVEWWPPVFNRPKSVTKLACGLEERLEVVWKWFWETRDILGSMNLTLHPLLRDIKSKIQACSITVKLCDVKLPTGVTSEYRSAGLVARCTTNMHGEATSARWSATMYYELTPRNQTNKGYQSLLPYSTIEAFVTTSRRCCKICKHLTSKTPCTTIGVQLLL
jgi:hypothetical protein